MKRLAPTLFLMLATAIDSRSAHAEVPVVGGARPLHSSCFDIASGDDRYLVTRCESGSLIGQLYDEHGVPLAPAFTISASGGTAAVASDGSGFLVVWVEGGNGENLRAARVSAEGVVLDGASVLVDDAHEIDSSGEPIVIRHAAPDVIWGGTQWLAAWWDSSFYDGATRAARISASGEVVDTVPLQLGTTSGPPHLASNGADFLAIVPSYDGGPLIRRIRPDGSSGGGGGGLYDSVATYGASPTGIGAIASDGTDYVVVYEGGYSNSENEGIWVATIDGSTVQVKARRQVNAATDARSSISFRNGRYFVSWDEGSEVRASRMSSDLEFLDGAAGFTVFAGRLATGSDLGETVFVSGTDAGGFVGRTIYFNGSAPEPPSSTPTPTPMPTPSATRTPLEPPSTAAGPGDGVLRCAVASTTRTGSPWLLILASLIVLRIRKRIVPGR